MKAHKQRGRERERERERDGDGDGDGDVMETDSQSLYKLAGGAIKYWKAACESGDDLMLRSRVWGSAVSAWHWW